MPGETSNHGPCSSIIIQSEDDVQRTVRPRLEVAGADLAQIHAVTGIEQADGAESAFHAVNHVGQLADAIDQLGDCKLLVIDPISEYMPGINFWKDDSLRPALQPLRRLAENKHIAVSW